MYVFKPFCVAYVCFLFLFHTEFCLLHVLIVIFVDRLIIHALKQLMLLQLLCQNVVLHLTSTVLTCCISLVSAQSSYLKGQTTKMTNLRALCVFSFHYILQATKILHQYRHKASLKPMKHIRSQPLLILFQLTLFYI